MALLKITELLATFRDAVLNSTDIANYIASNFPGKSLTVYTGMDQKNPPGENQSPFVILLPVTASLGETMDAHSYNWDMLVGVKDEVFNDWQSNGAIEMQGIYRLDDLCHLVIEEARKLSSVQNWIPDNIELQLDSTTYFPIHLGTISITSSFSNVLGYDIKLNGAE